MIVVGRQIDWLIAYHARNGPSDEGDDRIGESEPESELMALKLSGGCRIVLTLSILFLWKDMVNTNGLPCLIGFDTRSVGGGLWRICIERR